MANAPDYAQIGELLAARRAERANIIKLMDERIDYYNGLADAAKGIGSSAFHTRCEVVQNLIEAIEAMP